jgi:hypothetical protein
LNTTGPLNLLVAALVGALALTSSVARAGEIGHYAGGFMNTRDYFVPDPGFYAGVYNYFYTTDQLNDSHGHKVEAVTINPPGGGPGVTVNLDVHVNMYVVAPTFIYVTDVEALGIKFGALIAPNFANANLNAEASAATERGGNINSSINSFAAGDMFVQPVWLGKTLSHWDFALAYGFYAPVGKYNTETVTIPGIGPVRAESADNIGFGFWTQQIQGSVAWYPWSDKRMVFASTLTYETNGKKQDFNVTPGDNLTFNWGVSQYLPLTDSHTLLLEVGPAGYDTWQITNDSGSAATNTRDRVHAIGGQLSLVYLPWHTALTCHGFYEFAAQDRFQGGTFGISLTKKF